MPLVLLPRRVRALRPPSIGVLAASLSFAGVAVLLVVGVWASRLGDPPSWAFDCNDTTCTDLWAVARRHYLQVAAGAGLTTLLGAALGGFAVPRLLVPLREGPGHVLRRVVVPMLFTAAVLWCAFWLALAFSRPFGLAMALLGMLLALLIAWRWLRAGALSDRAAYWSAGLATMAPLLVGGALTLHPLALLVAVVILGSPWLGVPVLTVVLLLGTALMRLLLPRAGAEPQAGTRSAVPVAGPSPDAVRPVARGAVRPVARAAAPRGRSSPLVTSSVVIVILLLAVLAARPVDAPSADAWQYTDDSGHGPAESAEQAGHADPAGPGGPASGQGQSADGPAGAGTPSSSSDPAPSADPAPSMAPAEEVADLPPCSSDALQLVAEGWDGITGNSVAALRATNVGATACALDGIPELTLTQGGQEIGLRPEPLTHLEPTVEAAEGIGLAPGSSAQSRLYWPGYRTAADRETPQTLTVRIDPAQEAVAVRFLPTPYGDDPGPAPFDLKSGVEGGAVIEIGPWETIPSPEG